MKALSNMLKIGSKIKDFHVDGLENVLTGLGISGKDKRLGAKYKRKRYSWSELESFHDSSDIAKMVVNKVPELATKKWLTHKVAEEDGGMDMVNSLVAEDERLEVKDKFKKAAAWARLYGGAGIYMSVDDGLDPSEPLNINRIRRLNSLTVLHKEELFRQVVDNNIDSPNFGMPEMYYVSSREGGQHVPRVHHSRILRFEGSPLSEEGFRQNDYWNDSVLTILYQIASDYESAYNGVLHALQDFDIDILKIKDFADIAGSDEDGLIKDRLQLMQLGKSIMSSIMIDAEHEDFEKLQRQFNNIDKVLEKIDRRLQMATDLPHTVLFGDGSTGTLGASGESEQNTLNDLVAGFQDTTLTKPFNQYARVVQVQRQGPTNGRLLESWTYSYNKLNEPTERMQAETRELVAKADKIYYEISALSPDEIASSRWGGDDYSMETIIDKEARREQKEAREIDDTQE